MLDSMRAAATDAQRRQNNLIEAAAPGRYTQAGGVSGHSFHQSPHTPDKAKGWITGNVDSSVLRSSDVEGGILSGETSPFDKVDSSPEKAD